MKDKTSVEDLVASGASVRLVNAISLAIDLNLLPYSNFSEMPSGEDSDSLISQLRIIPGLGNKSAQEFVSIARKYRFAQPYLTEGVETKLKANDLCNMPFVVVREDAQCILSL